MLFRSSGPLNETSAGLGTSQRGDPEQWLKPTRFVIAGGATVLTLVASSLLVFGPWRISLFGLLITVTKISRPISTASFLWIIFAVLTPQGRGLLKSRSPFGFYMVATVIMWILSFGPSPRFLGQQILYWRSEERRVGKECRL